MDWERNVEFCVVDITFGKAGSGDRAIGIALQDRAIVIALLEFNDL